MAYDARACGITLILMAAFGRLASAGASVQDEVWGDNFDGFDTTTCDSGLVANSSTGTDYAKALDLCAITTDAGTGWGVISATLTQADGSSADAAVSHSIRSSFGSGNSPLQGAAMALLSTGTAVAQGDAGFVSFQPGDDTGTSSAAPSDWLTANDNQFPHAPNCPALSGGTSAINSEMLTLRIRVPSNARSFSFSANFFSADFPEWVCSPFNDLFVVLLDSGFSGAPTNPADKNLAMYFPPTGAPVPVGVNLASGNTGLFTQCVNGTVGCETGSVMGAISTCASTSGLVGTGMDMATPGLCDGNSLLGGGTGWLVVRGNVVPGEVITLRIAIWDVGDGTLDSLVLLDNFRWSYDTVTPGTTLN